MGTWLGDKVAITGVGFSEISRDSGLSEGELAARACRAAIADAGLAPSDIDGLTMFPHRTAPPTSFQGPSLVDVQRALGLHNLRFWHSAGHHVGQFGAIFLGFYALLAGQCTHLVTFRAHKRQARRYLGGLGDVSHAWDEEAYTLPYGAAGGAARLAQWATRHMHEYGTTQEQLGAVVLTCRSHALTNPRALWKAPLTLDQYMSSRWIATPFKLFDCDYPVDGAVALVLSAADAARERPQPPVFIESIGHAGGPDTSWSQWPDYTHMGSRYAAAHLWSGTDLRPSDVDVAELYDGFSWLAICWLEDLGFVQKGDGGSFFEAGYGRLGSRLPVCTDGGQLGIGRVHGFGKLAQATLQLRGAAGANQVPGAKVAVACAGAGPGVGVFLLKGQ